MNASPPIALFIFNRPDCTRRLLQALRSDRPGQLFIIGDGPRAAVRSDVERCDATRKMIEDEIDWPCEVRRHYADENLGCARRVASGLDWIFAQVDEAVVLEDDCIPCERFLLFCAELLARYRHESRVGLVAGSNFQRHDVTDGAGYYFSKYPHCWGWATWKRAWAKYDHDMAAWPELRRSNWLRSFHGSAREARYWQTIFDRVHAGEIDSWAYRWTFACWREGFLTALPAANLVVNIGFGAGATHTDKVLAAFGSRTWPQPWPLRHPAALGPNVAADRHTAVHHFDPPLWLRLYRQLRRSASP